MQKTKIFRVDKAIYMAICPKCSRGKDGEFGSASEPNLLPSYVFCCQQDDLKDKFFRECGRNNIFDQQRINLVIATDKVFKVLSSRERARMHHVRECARSGKISAQNHNFLNECFFRLFENLLEKKPAE